MVRQVTTCQGPNRRASRGYLRSARVARALWTLRSPVLRRGDRSTERNEEPLALRITAQATIWKGFADQKLAAFSFGGVEGPRHTFINCTPVGVRHGLRYCAAGRALSGTSGMKSRRRNRLSMATW